jgi:hypothetical protein
VSTDQNITAEKLKQIRTLDDFELTILISEVHVHGKSYLHFCRRVLHSFFFQWKRGAVNHQESRNARIGSRFRGLPL